MKRLIITSFVLTLIIASTSFGTSIKSKLQLGGGGYDEALTGEGDFIEGSHDEHTKDWAWSLITEFSQIAGSDTNGNSIVDHTYNFVPETSFETAGGFGVVGNYSYSYTPEESLVEVGPELDLYYNFDLINEPTKKAEGTAKKGENFVPNMKIKIGGKDQQLTQIFSGSTTPTKKGTTRPTTGFNTLRQIAALAEISASPIKLISFDFTYTYFFYDRNVANFLSSINQPDAARFGIGGFSSSITNFSQSTADGQLAINFIEDWSTEIEIINSISAVDLSAGWSYQITLYHDLGDWKAGLGYEDDLSPLTGDNQYGIISLAYDF